MHEVSKDLPDHFKNKFTKVSAKERRPNGKNYQPMFLSGISCEAPEFFKVRNVPVLNKEVRFEVYSRLSTPIRGKMSVGRRNGCRRVSVDANAGLPTGYSKHVGEFIKVTPSINRSLTVDEEVLRRYLERSCKTRIKKRRSVEERTGEEGVRIETQRTKVSKTRPKTAKHTQEDRFSFEPTLLTQKQSRLLYNF